MLAVQHNFIQGRKTHNVIAACLYTVCRREKTPHLLIDFSDVLQSNVYVLGSTFLKFTRLLSLVLPIIDPSLYIHRFASRLELGDKTHLVSMSALRLVQRMKRDWIERAVGRRGSAAPPSIAARVHGFRRTQREVVQIVRICDVTLRKRLAEFTQTPLGALTARQLESLNLEAFAPADPPSFTANRRAEALAAGDDNADPAYLLDARRAARAPLQLKAMKVEYLRAAARRPRRGDRRQDRAPRSTGSPRRTGDGGAHAELPARRRRRRGGRRAWRRSGGQRRAATTTTRRRRAARAVRQADAAIVGAAVAGGRSADLAERSRDAGGRRPDGHRRTTTR